MEHLTRSFALGLGVTQVDLARGLREVLCSTYLAPEVIYFPVLLRSLLRLPRFRKQAGLWVTQCLEEGFDMALPILLESSLPLTPLQIKRLPDLGLYLQARSQGWKDYALERRLRLFQQKYRSVHHS